MFRLFHVVWIGLALYWPAIAIAQFGDLESTLRRALIADPQLKASSAQRDAAQEQRAQAIAQVLPQISFQATKNSNTTEATNITNGGRGVLTTSQYDSDTKTAILKQAVFRPRLVFNLLQGNAKSEIGEAQLETARQRTIAKATITFVDYLARHENLKATRLEVKAAELRLLQADMLRKAGEVSDVELSAATSALATVRARLKEASSGLAAARREIASMTGLPVPENPRDGPWFPASHRILSIVKGTLLAGVQQIELSQHPEVIAQQLALESVRLEQRKATSDHLPTLDFVASVAEGTSASDIAIGRYTKTKTVGLQLYVPIFSGGATQSFVRENAALVEKAEYELQALRDRVENERAKTREEIDYRLDDVEAARAEFEATKQSLRAAEQGVNAGIQSDVDLAERQAKHQRAFAALARAVTDVIVSYTQYLLSLGVLGVEELQPLSAALAAR